MVYSVVGGILAISGVLVSANAATAGESPANENVRTIQNQHLVLGVDLSRGGAICLLSEREGKLNVINHFDHGRFVQQSYYGDRDGSFWNQKPWRWNPVQGGSWEGISSSILNSCFKPKSIEILTRPTHWATGESIPETEMEMNATLEGKAAHIRYRFEYSGTHQHVRTYQELPAVFVEQSLSKLVFYRGEKPWTGDNVSQVLPQWPNQSILVDENWAAYVNDQGWGVGIYSPRMKRITCYRYPPKDVAVLPEEACSYLAPIEDMAIGPGFSLEYDVWMTIGQLEVIRKSFEEIHQATIQ